MLDRQRRGPEHSIGEYTIMSIDVGWKRYCKSTPTRVRRLTAEDVTARGGIIHTMHGPARFEVGDYLGQDAKDEWPIGRRTIEEHYRQLEGPDAEGWSLYQPLDVREAVQMHEAFEAGGVWGKPEDYLLRKGDRTWPVDREIFEASYVPVLER